MPSTMSKADRDELEREVIYAYREALHDPAIHSEPFAAFKELAESLEEGYRSTHNGKDLV